MTCFQVCAFFAVKKKPSVISSCCLMWQKSKKIPELGLPKMENGGPKPPRRVTPFAMKYIYTNLGQMTQYT